MDTQHTRGVLSRRVQVLTAPVTSGQAAEVKLLVATKATVADSDREHVHVDDVLDIVGDIVKPASLASACEFCLSVGST